jgi:predicted SAM-dependent methyltransferase
LEHFPYGKTLSILQEWRRVLKPGGRLQLSVPDFDLMLVIYHASGDDIGAIMAPLMGGQEYRHNFHQTTFTRSSLTSLLTRAGFKDVRSWDPEAPGAANFGDWSNRQIPLKDYRFPISLNLQGMK